MSVAELSCSINRTTSAIVDQAFASQRTKKDPRLTRAEWSRAVLAP
jgi:hypothetical protein